MKYLLFFNGIVSSWNEAINLPWYPFVNVSYEKIFPSKWWNMRFSILSAVPEINIYFNVMTLSEWVKNPHNPDDTFVCNAQPYSQCFQSKRLCTFLRWTRRPPPLQFPTWLVPFPPAGFHASGRRGHLRWCPQGAHQRGRDRVPLAIGPEARHREAGQHGHQRPEDPPGGGQAPPAPLLLGQQVPVSYPGCRGPLYPLLLYPHLSVKTPTLASCAVRWSMSEIIFTCSKQKWTPRQQATRVVI